MTYICQGSFHINSSNIPSHQHTVIISEIHETLFIWSPRPCCVTQIFDQTETILFVKNFPRDCRIPWEFPEFSMFVEISEYFRFSRFVVTLFSTVMSSHNVQLVATGSWYEHLQQNQTSRNTLKTALQIYSTLMHLIFLCWNSGSKNWHIWQATGQSCRVVSCLTAVHEIQELSATVGGLCSIAKNCNVSLAMCCAALLKCQFDSASLDGKRDR